jgi:YHS domain-containing protein
MKKVILFYTVLLAFTLNNYAQQIDYNKEKGYVANGYDVVSYFSKKAVKGSSNYKYTYDNGTYKFSSESNLEKFKANPKMYIPQYGGWCAYAMADKGEKVTINPKTYEIRNGKLYLFYNAFFDNTFESWLEEMPDKLVNKANTNWDKIKYKS